MLQNDNDLDVNMTFSQSVASSSARNQGNRKHIGVIPLELAASLESYNVIPMLLKKEITIKDT